MLSKNDFEEYLQQIKILEQSMSDIYLECSESLEDQQIKTIFNGLSKSERRHANMVRNLLGLLKL